MHKHQTLHGPYRSLPGGRQVRPGPAGGRTCSRPPAGPTYLQHVSRDVLVTAVTADAKLGMVVGLAVGQPVPATSQAVRTGGGHPTPPRSDERGRTSPPAPDNGWPSGCVLWEHRLQHGLLRCLTVPTRGTGKVVPFRGRRNGGAQRRGTLSQGEAGTQASTLCLRNKSRFHRRGCSFSFIRPPHATPGAGQGRPTAQGRPAASGRPGRTRAQKCV